MNNLAVLLLWMCTLAFLAIRLGMIQKPPRLSLVEIETGSCMTIGTREIQEDCCGVMETKAGLMAVLADGMGKAYGGRIAGQIALETFKDIFSDYNAFDNPPYFFRKAYNSANREILKAFDNGQVGAASVGSVIISQNQLFYASAGNVKICVYRAGELVPMSVGHTIDQLALEGFKTGRISRETAITLLEDHRLYNYVGKDEFRDIELYDKPVSLLRGDVAVLMSDGVYEAISWKDLEDILASMGSCETMAFEIIQRINQLEIEEKDNASVVLIRV